MKAIPQSSMSPQWEIITKSLYYLFSSVAYLILYSTLSSYNFTHKFLYYILYLLVTYSHTNLPGMLNFVTVFPIVPIFNSSFLHHIKLLFFLMKALTFGDTNLPVNTQN